MSIKLKALGLGLLAMIAVGAVAVMNASAESSANGHFVADSPGTTKLDVTETPGTSHLLEFTAGGFAPIVCHESKYTASLPETASHITVTPSYAKCFTTGGTQGETVIETKGCDFTFTKPSINATATVNTVQLTCPVGTAGIVIKHAGCTVTVMPHHFKGVGYTKVVEDSKDAITFTADVFLPSGTVTLHNGFCALLGTNQSGTFKGSATIKGTNPAGGSVGITATGGA